MITRVLSRLSRVRMTLAYAAVLIAVSAAMVGLSPRGRAHVIAQASTNLHNLAHGHIGTLLGSAFITDAGPIYFWLPCLVCLLALAELIWRSGRLALVFITGHIGATLVVAAGLTAAIQLHWLPLSVARASDVGVSYGAVAVLGALTSAIPRRVRPAWMGFWIPVGIAAALLGEDFTDVGHSIALILGMLVATRLDGPAHWTVVRCALLTVSSIFGFFLLAHDAWSTTGGAAVGAVGAVTAEVLTRWRRLPKDKDPASQSPSSATGPQVGDRSRVEPAVPQRGQ